MNCNRLERRGIEHYSLKLVVVLIEFAFGVAAIAMVADYRAEHHSIVIRVPRLDRPIPGPMATMRTNRSMNLSAYSNGVVVGRPMHAPNVAYDELRHDESPMVHRIYSVKEILFVNLFIVFIVSCNRLNGRNQNQKG